MQGMNTAEHVNNPLLEPSGVDLLNGMVLNDDEVVWLIESAPNGVGHKLMQALSNGHFGSTGITKRVMRALLDRAWESLGHYISLGAVGINLALREYYYDADAKRVPWGHVNGIDYLLHTYQTPNDVFVYRGVGGDAFTEMPRLGEVITEPGYSSTSLSQGVALAFAESSRSAWLSHPYLLEISVPSGAYGRFVDRQDVLIARNEERELLLPRGSSFRINSIESVSESMTVIQMDLVNTGYIKDPWAHPH